MQIVPQGRGVSIRKIFPCSSTVERSPVKRDVEGSNPSGGANHSGLVAHVAESTRLLPGRPQVRFLPGPPSTPASVV